MRVYKACIMVALVTGIAAEARAQGTDSVVKLPSDIQFKAPVNPGPQTAILYGDPTKAGVYVMRQKIPAGFKVMPHWHPEEWRTAVVLSGTLYFGIGEQWDESKLKTYPTGTFYSKPPKADTTSDYLWNSETTVVAKQIHSLCQDSGTVFKIMCSHS